MPKFESHDDARCSTGADGERAEWQGTLKLKKQQKEGNKEIADLRKHHHKGEPTQAEQVEMAGGQAEVDARIDQQQGLRSTSKYDDIENPKPAPPTTKPYTNINFPPAGLIFLILILVKANLKWASIPSTENISRPPIVKVEEDCTVTEQRP